MKSSVLFLIALLSVVSAGGCAAGISRGDLLKELEEGTAPLIVDVRSQGEFDRDHIPGAVHIPFYAIGSGLAARGFSKKEPFVLYCEHGPRAGIAGLDLLLSGYEQVWTLDGSMRGWRKSEFPLEVRVRRQDGAYGTR